MLPRIRPSSTRRSHIRHRSTNLSRTNLSRTNLSRTNLSRTRHSRTRHSRTRRSRCRLCLRHLPRLRNTRISSWIFFSREPDVVLRNGMGPGVVSCGARRVPGPGFAQRLCPPRSEWPVGDGSAARFARRIA
ncbi:pentapeptide repeat-containing protein [Winogradskya humida]|uniref:pentapeptide repeat-containing protein n=1 Tax=Winogradskya humida TaxID=113566 RepID=UPI001941F10A